MARRHGDAWHEQRHFQNKVRSIERCSMPISGRLRSTLSSLWGYIEALDHAADCDPLEARRRWIASLEARIAEVEVALSSGQEGPAFKAPKT